MPQKRNSSPSQKRSEGASSAPQVMTWSRAAPALLIGALFDALRYLFLFFWFFGPAIIGLYCSTQAGGVAVIGGLLTKGCVAGAAALGAGGFAIAAAFGTVMAIAVGFLGWLTVTFIIFATDRRAFGENPFAILWLFEGLGASVFVMAWGIYQTQIRKERERRKNYEQEQAA